MLEKSDFLLIPHLARWFGSSFATAFALILWGFGCHSVPAGSPGSSETISIPGAIRVGTSGDYTPFSVWPEQEPEPSGFSVDVMRAFAAAEGRELVWVRFRWPDLLTDLASARFDVALSGVTLRPERSVAGRFSVPLATSGAIVLVPESAAWGRGVSTTELDAAGLRLAVNAGGHLERVGRSHFSHARIEAIPDNSGVLERLASGTVDGVITDTVEAPHWQAKRPGLQRVGPFTRDRKAALFRPTLSDLSRRFDAWLLEAERDGQLDRLRQRHGVPVERTATSTMALLASLDERLSLMPAVARAKWVLEIPIEDRTREQRVLSAAIHGVVEAADALGQTPPDEDAVQDLFRAQIEAAKWIQSSWIRSKTLEESASAPTPRTTPEEARRELDEALRPALIRIGDRIARLIVIAPSSRDEILDPAAVDRALARHALPENLLDAISSALQTLRRSEAEPASTPPPPRAAPGRAPNG